MLFIDEIHRLPKAVEEFLYPAMEDFRIDLTLGEGVNARTINMPLRPFTLIGATTRTGLLVGPAARPLPDARAPRFLHGRGTGRDRPPQREEAAGRDRRPRRPWKSPAAAAARRGWPTTGSAGSAITPKAGPTAGSRSPSPAMPWQMQGIDPLGLDAQDRKYLETIARVFGGGPVGVEAVAHTMNLSPDTLIDEVEPFLLRSELVVRTPRGRRLTPAAFEHLGHQPQRVHSDAGAAVAVPRLAKWGGASGAQSQPHDLNRKKGTEETEGMDPSLLSLFPSVQS